MMYGNGRPLGLRKRIQVVIAVVLLAWATQTLLHQWGFGAEVFPSADGVEKFVPGTARLAAGATLEVRGDATIVGAEVKLKQICRWCDADAAVFAPVADLIILRINHGSPFRSITVDQLRTTLHDAGMNLAMVKFAGPLSCTISRSDAAYDEQNALRQWAAAKDGVDEDAETRGLADAEKIQASTGPDSSSSLPASPRPRVSASSSSEAEASPTKSLRSLLVEDLAIRLGLPQDQLQVTFNPADEKLLNLSEPLFKFNIEARQVRDLGEVSWNVAMFTGNTSQKGMIKANARAWQNQVVLAKPLAYGQVVQSDDVSEKRILADRLPTDSLLSMNQVVGQQSARDLIVGSVVNARMVNGVPLVKPGQLVTITVTSGAVQVKTAGRAMEEGCYGQTVKVRNEDTRDIFEVVMTGPQQGSMGPLPAPAKVAVNDR
jgi:flagella basal body P-ring formation protein FlgA